MTEIIPLLICLDSHLPSTALRQLRHMIFAMLCIPKRATMLGLSRWSEKGGSYRTIQRLYHSPINWRAIHWIFLKTHLLDPDKFYLLVGDEVVEAKAGKTTHGVGRFYSDLTQRVIPSISVLGLSVVDVEERKLYPLYVQQIMLKSTTKDAPPAQPKRSLGRPKGSKSYAKPDPIVSPLLQLLRSMMTTRASSRPPAAHPVNTLRAAPIHPVKAIATTYKASKHCVPRYSDTTWFFRLYQYGFALKTFTNFFASTHLSLIR